MNSVCCSNILHNVLSDLMAKLEKIKEKSAKHCSDSDDDEQKVNDEHKVTDVSEVKKHDHDDLKNSDDDEESD